MFKEVPVHFKLIIGLVLIATILISWGFSTTGYKIFGNELNIKRPFGNKSFDVRDIKTAEKITRSELQFSIRKFGNGGFFGYYGKYWNKKFGSMSWFATNLNNAILMTFIGGKKIVLTPDEPKKFLSEINLQNNHRRPF